MHFLSKKEESNLSTKELKEYYEELRDYISNMEHYNLSNGSLTICPKINNTVKSVLNSAVNYDIVIDGNSDLNGFVGIYANTHQSKNDHINLVVSNPNHTILLNSSILSLLYKMVLNVNGVVYVNKSDKNDRFMAKLEMAKLLLMDKSVTIFPESAWNLSPNKLHLPLYIGIVDIARITGKPIIPVVQEYTYDDSKRDGVERVLKVHIKYGSPIYVSDEDDLLEKLNDYSTQVSTLRWELLEEKGIHSRKSTSNNEYINFVNGCVRNLSNAGIDINTERKGIFDYSNEFYLFNHINDIPFNENGEFIPTEHLQKLEKIYRDARLK